MQNSIDSIIVAGGKGSRLGKLSKEYGCKSLIPLKGIPSINYVAHAIRKVVPDSKLILAIDDPNLRPRFEKTLDMQGITNYSIYEGSPRGPVQAFYEAGSFCRSERALIFFGNQLISSKHIEKLLSHNTESMVFSGFNLLSENNCKIATLDESSKVIDVARYSHLEMLQTSETYLDVPYVVPNNFFSMETFPEIKRLFVKTPMTKVSLNNKEKVYVEKSDFPPEFHFKNEITVLEKYVEEHFSVLIKAWSSNE